MNWGYKLLVTYLAFAGLMSFLVYRAIHTDFQLVEKEYYKQELVYQVVIDGRNNTNPFRDQLHVDQHGRSVKLDIPPSINEPGLEGAIWMYCVYDNTMDFRTTFQTDSSGAARIAIPAGHKGKYTAKVNWQKQGVPYYFEKDITLK